jgi:HK97 family phage major capsid protein
LEQRARVFEQARALVLKAENEKRALTSDEQTEYDKRMSDVKALGDTIQRSRESAQMDADLSRSIGPNAGNPANPAGTPSADLANSAMTTFLRSGARSLTAEQRSVFGQNASDTREHIVVRAASPLSDVTGAAGAYTIPQGFYNNLEQARKWFGGMRQSNATVWRTASGNAIPYPTVNDTNNTGEYIAENAAVSQASTEMSFGRVTFNAYKLSSKLVLVPFELIQDSAFDITAKVASLLGERLGRSENTAFTTGGGSTLPTGVVTAATLGITGATGQTTSVQYNDLVNIEHSVDPAYRVGAQFMFHDQTAAFIETLKDGNGRPLLASSLVGINGDISAGKPGITKYTIKGYEVVINNDMPVMAANAKSLLFGDFSKYVIRDVLDMMLIRFGEKFMDQGQIGFLCYARNDGNLVDAGSHPIKWYANSAT